MSFRVEEPLYSEIMYSDCLTHDLHPAIKLLFQ